MLQTRTRLRTKDAAEYLALSKSTLEKMRLYGNGPIFAKIGKNVIYRIEDLDSWTATKIRRSTSDFNQ